MLNLDQHCRLMNIVSLEGSLGLLTELKESIQGTDCAHKFHMMIHKTNDQLKTLTLDKAPSELLEEMLIRSKDYS